MNEKSLKALRGFWEGCGRPLGGPWEASGRAGERPKKREKQAKTAEIEKMGRDPPPPGPGAPGSRNPAAARGPRGPGLPAWEPLKTAWRPDSRGPALPSLAGAARYLSPRSDALSPV